MCKWVSVSPGKNVGYSMIEMGGNEARAGMNEKDAGRARDVHEGDFGVGGR